MRSLDYCHFEIVLTHDAWDVSDILTASGVDELRKAAARLADKAVEQYAKKRAAFSILDSPRAQSLKDMVAKIQEKPDDQWTPEDKAIVKELNDQRHAAQYDYEDDEPA